MCGDFDYGEYTEEERRCDEALYVDDEDEQEDGYEDECEQRWEYRRAQGYYG